MYYCDFFHFSIDNIVFFCQYCNVVLKKLLFFLFVSILFVSSRSLVFASEKEKVIFEDIFSNFNTNIWEVKSIGGSVTTGDGLSLTANQSRYFPFIYSKEIGRAHV